MESHNILEYGEFISSVRQNRDSKFGFLLGAGTSLSSGVQSASDCIWDWKREIYCRYNENHRINFPDARSKFAKSQIQKWLDAQGGYPALGAEEEYVFYAEKAHPIASDRVRYFNSLIHDKVPYVGYRLLCLLNKYSIVESVWTTNFDGMAERAAHQMNITPKVITLDNQQDIYRTISNTELMCISLHGDYKYSTLKNTSSELDNQSEVFCQVMTYYFTTRHLVVLGYSGRDNSLMSALKNTFTTSGAGRLYWCGIEESPSSKVLSLIQDIRNSGREAFYIQVESFDKTMISLSLALSDGNREMYDVVMSEMAKYRESVKLEPFKVKGHCARYLLRDNLYPIKLPNSLLKVDLKSGANIADIRKVVKNKPIFIAEQKGTLYAIASYSDLESELKEYFTGDIVRTPISLKDISANGAFKSIFLKAILYGLSKLICLNCSFGKRLIWGDKVFKNVNGMPVLYALSIGLNFIEDKEYATLSLRPELFFTDKNMPKEQRQEVSRQYFSKLWNKKYDETLKEWESIIFKSNHLKFCIPKGNERFQFQISNNSSLSLLLGKDHDPAIIIPQQLSNRILFRGGIIPEPLLCFPSINAERDNFDWNQMRGLVRNKPTDYWKDEKFSIGVSLSVIAPIEKSGRFASFISNLSRNLSPVKKDHDYLVDYPGFNSAYHTQLFIPSPGTDKWQYSKLYYTSAYEIASDITLKINRLAINGQSVILIFIPKEWEKFKTLNHKGEKIDLHNYIKAYCASRGITTQLIEEKTLTDIMLCEKIWWLSLAIYVKSLRTPWTLASLDENTAYAGIGYSILSKVDNEQHVVMGCSHIYNRFGEGLKYKLQKVNNPIFDRKNNPYMSYEEAYKFGTMIQNLFLESMDKLPTRVVIHKRTHFRNDEINGIKDSLKAAGIETVELLTIEFECERKELPYDINRYGVGIHNYPIKRGAYIVISDNTFLLWTHGVVPSIRNESLSYYPGGIGIPAPLKITRYSGSSTVQTIATEILGFTKMNWNSFNLYTKLPATIDTSNTLAQVSHLLRHKSEQTFDYRLFI